MRVGLNRAALQAAKKLTRMIAPALLPSERRLFFRKAYEICRRLATRGIDPIKLLAPSMN
ncbi:MAG TPA: hypothetical protein VFE62_09695 [Gemmataceae bacterium]|nr:hypothetical protein [Gemmataceae bacterium]